MADLPCDADGVCMACKETPPDEHVLLCSSCTSPWHMQCLNRPLRAVPSGDWECPDCSMSVAASVSLAGQVVPDQCPTVTLPGTNVVGMIRAIQADLSLSEAEKARRRQELLAHHGGPYHRRTIDAGSQLKKEGKGKRNETLEMLDQNLNCTFCMQLADRPVTTPCGHNFCLKCFLRWIGQGKKTCAKCRALIPPQMATQPRINLTLVMAIRLAKSATPSGGSQGPPKPYHHIDNEKRPDKCFTSERAVKTGKANACSGRIFVTIPLDHFGPILPENDPLRSLGVQVGESWEGRMECRQWGAHFPHVAGIAGQCDYGAQSVALSGGYEDDEDHGEWFLYTGSGGRDLSGNKRTSKEQAFDQKFDKLNEALRVSCKRGYPVRVVRSHKEKNSSYAPEKGVRYDGVYRIEMCWRKTGVQGHKVCRYLFVRCDNEPAPWTSDEHGDRPRPFPNVGELKDAIDVFERRCRPSWEWMEESGVWGWTKDPPESRKAGGGGNGEKSSKRKHLNIQQKLLKEFGCSICRGVMQLPISTPCGHNFCKPCLLAVFSGKQDMRERKGVGGRSLRVQKVMKRCPTCTGDITDFISCPQVNRQMEDVILSLQTSVAEGDEEEQQSQRIEGKRDAGGTLLKDVHARPEMAKDLDEKSRDPPLLRCSLLSKSTGNHRQSQDGNDRQGQDGNDWHSQDMVTDDVGEPTAGEVILSKRSAAHKSSGGFRNEVNVDQPATRACDGPPLSACGGSVVKGKGKLRGEESSESAGLVKSKRNKSSQKGASDEVETMQKSLRRQGVSDSEDIKIISVRSGGSRPAGSSSHWGQDSDTPAVVPHRSWTRSQRNLALSSTKISGNGIGGCAAEAIEL